MSDLDRRFHEQWLGLVQSIDGRPSMEGLVVSVPVLVDAQCAERRGPEWQHKLRELCPDATRPTTPTRAARAKTSASGPVRGRRIADLDAFFEHLLGLPPARFDRGDALPEALGLYVQEGQQLLRPSLALRGRAAGPDEDELPAEQTPASRAGRGYVMLVWSLPPGGQGEPLPLDQSETVTGRWDYPPAAKFERLLRNCRVPIGLLVNGAELRLMYAPHGESSGWITFSLDAMAESGGRPILDAFLMLLSSPRFFAVAPDQQLPALLRQSRIRQANVTTELAAQVFDALEILLAGFEAAAERDGATGQSDGLQSDGLQSTGLRDALARDDDHLYSGLLTLMLRLVFLLYAEDRGLMPVGHHLYDEHLSLLGLYQQLQRDHGNHPDTMGQRFGAYDRLLSVFRAVFLGLRHGDLDMPARRGHLFDPHAYPFLEGWEGGSAPIRLPENRAELRTPSVDDGTVFAVLHRLLYFQGQRLSYRALDVEQIGSVYEALMGYHVAELEQAAVCLRPDGVWLTPAELERVPPGQRAKWLKTEAGLSKAQADKVHKAFKDAEGIDAQLEALALGQRKGTRRAAAGRLVIQPGAERKRTSSHYTPRKLSAPIVRRTLEPLLAAMGDEPCAEALLELKICDPAMGSGAFLVEACRYLADQVVAAWTRQNALERIADAHDDVVNHARRLVAQRCLYGVDKNPFAVHLAKLSLWLLTQGRELPFTFLDHSLRHGDSLVGVSFAQIEAFHWKDQPQVELLALEIRQALDEAVDLRECILARADDASEAAQRDKEILLADAEDALSRVKLVADLLVGAYFAAGKDKARDKERKRRLGLVQAWLGRGEPPPDELLALQTALRARIPAFHWMVEFPEVFHRGRRDPLGDADGEDVAYMDAFVGNPPFAGKNTISEGGGPCYLPWLQTIHPGAHGNADLSAHFFRRAADLLGDHGSLGLIATNTIAQGDTRATGLQPLVNERGFRIYAATRSLAWPVPGAAVTVGIVHAACGNAIDRELECQLDGQAVPAISSRLRGTPERPDPVGLPSNASCSFVGSYVLGMGFTLTPEERDRLVDQDARNAARIRPYLGGEEVNTSPTHDFHRYVIDFGQMSLDEAEAWPDLLDIVRTKVKPERDRLRDNADGRRRKTHWWQWGRYTPALYEAIAPLERCLVTSIHSKHLCFAFQPADRVFSHALFAFALDTHTAFAVLQSRIHEAWARLLSSSLEDRLRYAASDCFETFPFPRPDSRAVVPALEALGGTLYEARAAHMVDTDQGLTKTYNALKDPSVRDPRIQRLRDLHRQLDQAVLDAYGWDDLDVPPYRAPTTRAEATAHKAFEDAVIDRLFLLNTDRAQPRPSERPPSMPPKALKPLKRVEPRPGSAKRATGS